MKITLSALAAIFALGMMAPVATFAADATSVVTADTGATIDKRSKPRVPGGSGCDDPRDLIEHPECRG